jgi:hypothetical protein
MHFDASSATCLIFTFKEGMLSAIAHDLKLQVTRFEVTVEGLESGSPTRVQARFETASLRVVCAMKDGMENHAALSEGDRRKIEQTITDEVLPPKRAAEVRFRSTRLDGDRIEGTLSINGVERPLVVQARREAGKATVEVEVNQPDFGIKPYTAALGTLRIHPRVRVQLSVPLPGLSLRHRLALGRDPFPSLRKQDQRLQDAPHPHRPGSPRPPAALPRRAPAPEPHRSPRARLRRRRHPLVRRCGG